MNKLNLNGNEDLSNETPMQNQRTDVAEAVAATGVHEGVGVAQNVETPGLDSITMQQVKNSGFSRIRISVFMSMMTLEFYKCAE